MKSNIRWHLLAIVMFFGAAFFIKMLINEQFLMKRYAQNVSNNLQVQTKEVESILSNTKLVQEILAPTHTQSFYDFLEQQNTKPYSICFYQGDSLVFYTNNLIVPIQENILSKINDGKPTLMKLINGFYSAQRVILDVDKRVTAVSFVLLKRDFPVENNYLKNSFVAGENISSKINLNTYETPYPIQLNGKNFCYLTTEEVRDTKTQYTILGLFMLGLISLLTLITRIADNSIRKHKQWQGGLLILATFFAINYFLQTNWATKYFSNLEIFEKDIYIGKGGMASLVDILLSIVMLSWVLVFFYRTYSSIKYIGTQLNQKLFYAVINLTGIVICLSLITFVYKQLSFNDKVFLQFDKLYNINSYSTLALLGTCLLLFVLFLLSYHAFKAIFNMELDKKYRIIASLVAVILASLILYITKLDISLSYFALFSFIYLLVFDIFVDNNSFGLVWILIWLVIFSAFSAACIYKYGRDKDYSIRKAYAKSLASVEDSLLETRLKDFTYCISKDSIVSKAISQSSISKANLLAAFQPCFESSDYLVDNYVLDVAYFSKADSLRHQSPVIKVLKDIDTRISLVQRKDGQQMYLVHLKSNAGTILELNVAQNIRESSEIYKDLMMHQPYKKLQNLNNYSYVVYKNGVAISQDKQTYPLTMPDMKLPPINQFEEKITGNRHDIIYRPNEEFTVFIGKESIGLFNVISFFSLIFTLMGTMLFIFIMVNAYLQVLPMPIFFRNPSLQIRIQMAIISILIGTLITVGRITSSDIQNTLLEKNQQDLEAKLDAVMTDLSGQINSAKGKNTNEVVAHRLTALSKMNRIDIHYFDASGKLVKASESDIFNKGIIAEQLNSIIYNWLKFNKTNTKLYQDNYLGAIAYRSAYSPLVDGNKQLLGFIELPYYSMNKVQQMEVARLSGTNQLNIYVLLFLVACALSIFIANNITEPLQELNKKLSKFKLGDKNEPLQYDRQDEIGALITAYNQMINKVEVSSQILMENKRISGFKEMASQASHDIKNALMPMKLSTEYLVRKFKTDPDDIESFLPRISKTILEHIEMLADTANEFSLFADVRKANNLLLPINDVLSNVYELNRHAKEGDLTLSMPDEKIIVFMDKNHMNRVITNLIKNALEAIPEGRRGRVDVVLKTKNEKAIISVQDNGKGIPEGIRQSIFEFKFSTKQTGRGLGLPTCKDFIESIGGKIFLESEVNIGTTFFIELPLMGVEELV